MATISTVAEGATLECTLGTTTSKLQLPKSHDVLLKGKKQADISDSVGNVNIMPFGTCTRQSPPVPCTPTTCMKWVLFRPSHSIKNEPVLLDCCIIPCVLGGIIRIIDPGQ